MDITLCTYIFVKMGFYVVRSNPYQNTLSWDWSIEARVFYKASVSIVRTRCGRQGQTQKFWTLVDCFRTFFDNVLVLEHGELPCFLPLTPRESPTSTSIVQSQTDVRC